MKEPTQLEKLMQQDLQDKTAIAAYSIYKQHEEQVKNPLKLRRGLINARLQHVTGTPFTQATQTGMILIGFEK